MPTDQWSDALRMAGCGATVAMAAFPVALVAWRIARRRGESILPGPKPWRSPWSGFEVVLAFLTAQAIVPGLVFLTLSQTNLFQTVYGPDFPRSATIPGPSFEASSAVSGPAAALAAREHLLMLSAVRAIWAGLVSFPLQLGALMASRVLLDPRRRFPVEARLTSGQIALAILTWAVLAPGVLVIHAVVNLAFTQLDWPIEEHPFSKLSVMRPALDQALLALQAGVAAPVIEESLFRGVLLGWLVGGRTILGPTPRTSSHRSPGDRRVWSVLALGVIVAAVLSGDAGQWFAGPIRGPVLFAVGLLVGWAVLRRATRKRRTVGAVYSSAALFAIVHSSVWPSPIPLFVLGLGLGWLAVRTRSVVAPAIVHGLFNTVSVLFVLGLKAIP